MDTNHMTKTWSHDPRTPHPEETAARISDEGHAIIATFHDPINNTHTPITYDIRDGEPIIIGGPHDTEAESRAAGDIIGREADRQRAEEIAEDEAEQA